MSAEAEKSSVYRHMIRGSAWAIAMRWGIRVIGFVSVIILARLLTPDDFGIVAMGALTIGFINGFTELGVQMLLIREKDVDRDHCDTAWTIKILQGLFIGLLLVLLAPVAARYFQDQRVIAVIWLLALGGIFDGAQNIGMVLARKELDFARDFRFHIYVRITSFVITISLAFLLRSYWALILGQVISSFLSIPFSFLMHPYRPRFCLSKARQYLTFASSIIPMKIGKYLNGKVDAIVVGGVAGASQLGTYNVASELATIFTREILTPVGRGLMPNYAKLNDNPEQLSQAFEQVLRASGIVIMPLGFGIWSVAEHLVVVLLGQKWIEAIPLLELLALYSMTTGLMHMMSAQILLASGHERRSAMLMWLRLTILVPVVVAAGALWGVQAVAAGALLSALLAFPIVAFVLTQSIKITLTQIAGALWRPFVAAIAMAAVVRYGLQEAHVGAFFKLMSGLALGAATYSIIVLLLWLFRGKPAGLESAVVGYILSIRSRRSS